MRRQAPAVAAREAAPHAAQAPAWIDLSADDRGGVSSAKRSREGRSAAERLQRGGDKSDSDGEAVVLHTRAAPKPRSSAAPRGAQPGAPLRASGAPRAADVPDIVFVGVTGAVRGDGRTTTPGVRH
jgi:hypothetical protein